MPISYSPVTGATNLEGIVSSLLSSGIEVVSGSVSYLGGTTAGAEQGALFQGGSALGIESGLLLTTGDGTPPDSNTESGYGVGLGGPSDDDLQEVVAAEFSGDVQTADANVLQFDVRIADPNVTSVTFKFVFASDEFPEYSTSHPDVAGIFVDGVNYAYFANGKPLSVLQENVDDGFFNADGSSIGLEYDGVSTVLILTVPLGGGLGAVHTIKLAIADTGDDVVDSGIFIGSVAGSKGDGGPIVGSVVAVNDLRTVSERVDSVSIPAVFTGNVLANDKAKNEGAGLTVTAVNGVTSSVGSKLEGEYGSLRLDADGTYKYSVLNTNKLISGESGIDTFTYQISDGFGGTDEATIKLKVLGRNLDLDASGSFNAHRGDDIVRGGTGVDKFAGRAGDDELFGFDGNDTLWGEDGNDELSTGAGEDKGVGGAGNDKIWLGANNDTGWGEGGADRIYGDAGNDELVGDSGDDILNGGADNDTLLGQGGDDQIVSGSGDDRGWGGSGNDRMWGDSGQDQLAGGAGNDMLAGGNDDDKLWGDSGNDTLYGGTGADQLVGGTGNDRLYLDAGNDTAWGGDDSDRFIFTPGFGEDTIKDLRAADRIVFDGGFTNLTEVKANMSTSGDHVVIDLPGAGNKITVEHVSSINDGMFLFV